jgi:hypothetical protein
MHGMTHRKGTAAAAIATLLVLATPNVAAAADADLIREAQDRAAITELMWNYARALDSWNEDAYALVFTPDGSFGAAKGRDALRKMVSDLEKGRAEREAKGEKPATMHHIMSNQHIEFIDRDRARVHYYWMTVFAPQPQPAPPQVAAAGRGVDEVVRVDGRWLIKTRNVAPQD